MKYYKDKNGNVFAYEADGSQDDFIPAKLVRITEAEANAIRFPPVSKAQKWEDIKADRDRRKDGGVKVGAKWFHTDDGSKTQHLANKDTARDQLAAGGQMGDFLLDPETGDKIPWKTMDGTFIPLTCQLTFDIVKAAKSVELATFAAAEKHRAAMEASTDPASYDYSTGWPKIYGE